jgi:hypothetical protein
MGMARAFSRPIAVLCNTVHKCGGGRWSTNMQLRSVPLPPFQKAKLHTTLIPAYVLGASLQHQKDEAGSHNPAWFWTSSCMRKLHKVQVGTTLRQSTLANDLLHLQAQPPMQLCDHKCVGYLERPPM